jgi:hypothetical protein
VMFEKGKSIKIPAENVFIVEQKLYGYRLMK